MAFGGIQQQSHSAPMSEINMIPLVDIMLVLLVIFIITAPLLTHAIKVDLPQASSPPDVQPQSVSLSLNEKDELFWNNEHISDAELSARLAAAAQRQPQPELQLRADRNTRYQRFAQVMATARNAGIAKLGFVTESAMR